MWRIFSKAAGIVAYLSLQAVVNPIYPHSPKQAQVTGMHSIAAPQGINASPLVLPVLVATLFHCPWGRKTSTDPQLPSSSVQFSSVQISRTVVSDYLRPHESQHARPPCPSKTPGVYSNSRPSSQWCHPAISSSIGPFSCCPQLLPASGSFPMSQFFEWGGQSTGVSASTSVLPMNTQDWSPLGWAGWISLQSKGLSRVFSNTTVQRHQFFSAQLPSQSNSHIHTWPLEKP